MIDGLILQLRSLRLASAASAAILAALILFNLRRSSLPGALPFAFWLLGNLAGGDRLANCSRVGRHVVASHNMRSHHTLWQHKMLKDGVRDRLGFAFFAFATLIAGFSAWQSPSILAWYYLKREPARRYDRAGMWLGLVAALLPTSVQSGQSPWYLLIPGLAGYALILWSLAVLGKRFGIALAERGLTSRGPYQLIRHPMYLGELTFRAALLLSSSNLQVDGYLVIHPPHGYSVLARPA